MAETHQNFSRKKGLVSLKSGERGYFGMVIWVVNIFEMIGSNQGYTELDLKASNGIFRQFYFGPPDFDVYFAAISKKEERRIYMCVCENKYQEKLAQQLMATHRHQHNQNIYNWQRLNVFIRFQCQIIYTYSVTKEEKRNTECGGPKTINKLTWVSIIFYAEFQISFLSLVVYSARVSTLGQKSLHYSIDLSGMSSELKANHQSQHGRVGLKTTMNMQGTEKIREIMLRPSSSSGSRMADMNGSNNNNNSLLTKASRATGVTSRAASMSSLLYINGSTHMVAIKEAQLMEKAMEIWFSIMEAQFELRKIAVSETQFYHVLAALPPETVARIFRATLASDKYLKLKADAINLYAQSKSEPFEKLISPYAFNTAKPSLCLEQLNSIVLKAGVGEDLVNHKFAAALPSQLAPVLATQTGTTADGKARKTILHHITTLNHGTQLWLY
ncbi:hypothetical protein GQR58_017507 [Nymphon striatum]|nr:hypothetical protein GQR58_017507 [Nymphon striatum]